MIKENAKGKFTMYDIEGEFNRLMLIAKGKIPVLQKNDKQMRYSRVCAQVWDANVLIKSCQKDERKMLKNKIIDAREAAERGKNIFEL